MTKSKKTTEKKVDKKEETKKKNDIQQEEHQVVVDNAETVNQIDDDLTNRINMLYGVSSGEIKQEKQYDPQELEEVRKKLILLLIGLIIFGVIIVVVLLNPFNIGNNNNKEPEKPAQVEKEEEGIPLGVIDSSDPIVVRLNDFVSFSVNDFMGIDLFPLYASDSLELNNVPNDIKLYLFKKSDAFNKMLNDVNTNEYIQTCDPNGIKITQEAFDKAIADTFGPDFKVLYENINHSYSNEEIESKKITMTYNNGEYLLTCNEYIVGTAVTKFVQQSFDKAVKVEGAIEIYQNVVFINPTGVYKDTNFTQLITNDVSAELEDYISKGTMYKYTFTEDGENYYLSKIEKVIETNE